MKQRKQDLRKTIFQLSLNSRFSSHDEKEKNAIDIKYVTIGYVSNEIVMTTHNRNRCYFADRFIKKLFCSTKITQQSARAIAN